ncbi:14603_t:CDS:2 [Rhizophagus irregularis]|nr:14603_t:CDS:2 [Rhizophagus irregularis]
MNYIQIQSYLGFWTGASIMMSLHNLFISVMLYKARQANASNILKIIFNFAQIVRSGANFGLYMTPKIATYIQCDALLRTIIVGNIMTRLSLLAFLILRLRQIRNVHNYRSDKWISIILFSIKVALSVPYFIFQQASTEYVPEVDIVSCHVDFFTPIPYGASGIVVEFLIDIFVTFRLVQILVNANKNVAQVSINIKSKRSVFTAVMYWNFLRLFVSFVFHFMAVLDMIYVLPEVESITIKNIIYIALSYVISADAEIVQVIEGKEGSSSGSAGTEKPLNSTHSQIENDKIVVASMKKLSFNECAKVVVLGKHGTPKSSKDNNLEKDLSIEVYLLFVIRLELTFETLEKVFTLGRSHDTQLQAVVDFAKVTNANSSEIDAGVGDESAPTGKEVTADGTGVGRDGKIESKIFKKKFF